MEIIEYSLEDIKEKKIEKVEELFKYKDLETVTWINIDGLHDTDVIEKMGNYFGIHPLTLEDIVQIDQRAKIEMFEDYIFIVMKMLDFNEEKNIVEGEQIGIVLGKNFVISFQEGKEGDVFNPLRDRIRGGKGRIRKMGADYLFYALIDIIIDNYLIILEKIGEKIEKYEEVLIENPNENIIKEIYELKREILYLKKVITPLREISIKMEKSGSKLITEKTEPFLRDLYDHSIQAIEAVETYREMVSFLRELYLSSLSNKMNQVMRVLTTISTIFIPLTFIAGVYGMNFENMPELKTKNGYFLIMGIMLAIGIGMYKYFKNKEWL
jgi:magnesium transporter